MSTVDKVKKWAEHCKAFSKYVSGDSNVTYEDILELCEIAGESTPVVPVEDPETDEEDEDVDYLFDN